MVNRSDALCHDFLPSTMTRIYLPRRCSAASSYIPFHPRCSYCGGFIHRTTGTNRRAERTVCNMPSSFSEAGREGLPLACCCLSERKARRPGARCPLSVHTLPSAASCFVTQHDSVGHIDGGALRATSDQLAQIQNFLYQLWQGN